MRWSAPPSFVGRAAELSRILHAAATVEQGAAQVVWIEGEAGAGKSALAAAAMHALNDRGFGCRAVEVAESSGDQPFALLRELDGDGAGGPSAVLRLADALEAGRPGSPAALLIEDLHWADPESLAILLGAVRRSREAPLLVLVTTRPDPRAPDGWERLRLDEQWCALIVLRALSEPDVGQLAMRLGMPLSARAAARLHAHTAGHPLYVRTLLHELEPWQLEARRLPAPRSLAAATGARLAELPPPSQSLADALAVLGRPSQLALAGRVAGVADPTAALQALLATGFVGRSDREIDFTHPLYRTAVYAGMAPVTARGLHLAAAAHTSAGISLGHRVAAADGPDPQLLGDLMDAADDALVVGERGAAVRYLLQAESISPTRRDAEHCLLSAARILLDDGHIGRAGLLRARIEEATDTPLRRVMLGALEWEAGRPGPAEAHLRRAALDAVPGSVEWLTASARLAAMLATRSQGAEAVALAAAVLEQPTLPLELDATAWAARTIGTAHVRGAPAALALLRPRLPQPPEAVGPADASLLVVRGTMSYYAGRLGSGVADLGAALRLIGPRGGGVDQLPRLHLQLAHLQVLTGMWDDATVHARLALALIDDESLFWIRGQAHAALAQLSAVRGRFAVAQTHLAAAAEAAGVAGTVETAFTARIAEAAVARARNEPAGVSAPFEALLRPGAVRALPMASSLGWWPGVISALIETGRTSAAESSVEALALASQERGLDLRAQVSGLRAQLRAASPAATSGDAAEAVVGYQQALALATPDTPLLARVDLHARLARLLLARGDRSAGIAQLAEARALLAPSGAGPYLDRIDHELRSVGAITAVAPEVWFAQLTEREQDVVAQVGAGLTNREVAASLYVSEKAVEYHLGHVFAKLGVRSRRELRARLRPVA